MLRVPPADHPPTLDPTTHHVVDVLHLRSSPHPSPHVRPVAAAVPVLVVPARQHFNNPLAARRALRKVTAAVKVALVTVRRLRTGRGTVHVNMQAPIVTGIVISAARRSATLRGTWSW